MKKLPIVAAFIALIAVRPAQGIIVWNETVHGDLSGNRFNPTDIALQPGTNSVIATSVAGDREYLTISVAAGRQLESLVLASYVGLDETAFIAVQAGTVMTEPPTGTNPDNLLGWSHFGSATGGVGTDYLDNIGNSSPAIGFTPPLPSGNYTFWIQQIGSNACTYQFDFNVSPEPATLMLLAVPLALIRRRR